MSHFFDGRTIVNAGSLSGPRVYSTDLFPAAYHQADPAGSVAIISRALKIKLITKGTVTLNSLYLLSPAGVALFEADTGLFDGKGILPAFRDDQADLDLLIARNEKELTAAGIGGSRLDEHVAKLKASMTHVMPWTLGDVGEKLRGILLDGLGNDNSRISRALTLEGVDAAARAKLMSEITNVDMSASANVRSLLNIEPQSAARILNAFVTASYHKIGAAVVNCEIGTDLHPLSQYKAADMLLAASSVDGAMQLTDEAIFLDSFAGMALAAVQTWIAGDRIMDAINFRAAHELSNALREQGFQAEYDKAISKVMALTSSNGKLDIESLDMDDIAQTVTHLHDHFTDAVARELPKYETQGQQDAKERIWKAGADLLRDGASQFPVVSNIVSTYDAVQHVAEGAEAASDLVSLRTTKKALEHGARARQAKMTAAIDKLYAGEKSKSKLLDGVAVMSDLYIKAVERI
jgi:hypothetical protein